MAKQAIRDDSANLAVAVHLDHDGAFEEMVRAYQDRLYGYTRRLLTNPEDAQEVTQDALVQAYRCLAFKYDEGRCRALALKPWLFQVARRLALNRLRSRRQFAAAGAVEPADLETASCATDGHDPMRTLEDRAALETAFSRLGRDDRELVALRFVEGMSYAEIASLTGGGEASARGKIFRALKKLRIILSEE